MGPDEIAKLIYSNSIKSTVKNIKIKTLYLQEIFKKLVITFWGFIYIFFYEQKFTCIY